MSADLIPSFSELMRIAPVVTIIMTIAAIGYFAGWKSRDGHIGTLKEWLDDFRNRPKRTNKDDHDVDD